MTSTQERLLPPTEPENSERAAADEAADEPTALRVEKSTAPDCEVRDESPPPQKYVPLDDDEEARQMRESMLEEGGGQGRHAGNSEGENRERYHPAEGDAWE